MIRQKPTNYIILILMVMTLWPRQVQSTQAAPLPDLIQQTRFIAYTPRSFSIAGGKITAASATSIRKDLTLLRPSFNGLITYSATSGLEAIPQIAHELAYRAVILGIWDPKSETEIDNVIHAAQKYPTLVVAIIIGNEGLYTRRYLPQDVQKARQRIKKECPSLAITTSEPFFLYFEKEYTQFFTSHDLLMPNIHPVFEKWFTASTPPRLGVDMVVQMAEKFKTTYNKPLLIKETGLPSGPEDQGFSPKRQTLFWSELLRRFPFSPDQSLACFEAFDAPWKPQEMGTTLPGNHATEAFWGFFTQDGKGKHAVDSLPKLQAR
jgi:exo-beta-1,3-glucanase (GH17 family)